MMTALLQQRRDVLRTGPLGSGMAPDSAAATRRSEEQLPRSPPQPVPPRPQRGSAPVAAQQPAASSVEWEDALGVAASPASSDATEQFLDCYSERECVGGAHEHLGGRGRRIAGVQGLPAGLARPVPAGLAQPVPAFCGLADQHPSMPYPCPQP